LSIDLRGASYEEFVMFVFDHDHTPEDDVDNLWYWKLEEDVEIEPRRAIEHLTRVCEQAAALLDSYTVPQIAQGINYLFGAGNRDGFLDLLWDPQLPWSERYRCIRAFRNSTRRYSSTTLTAQAAYHSCCGMR
jgi:hypothetical protein